MVVTLQTYDRKYATKEDAPKVEAAIASKVIERGHFCWQHVGYLIFKATVNFLFSFLCRTSVNLKELSASFS